VLSLPSVVSAACCSGPSPSWRSPSLPAGQCPAPSISPAYAFLCLLLAPAPSYGVWPREPLSSPPCFLCRPKLPTRISLTELPSPASLAVLVQAPAAAPNWLPASRLVLPISPCADLVHVAAVEFPASLRGFCRGIPFHSLPLRLLVVELPSRRRRSSSARFAFCARVLAVSISAIRTIFSTPLPWSTRACVQLAKFGLDKNSGRSDPASTKSFVSAVLNCYRSPSRRAAARPLSCSWLILSFLFCLASIVFD
jgi:hypothetical protein